MRAGPPAGPETPDARRLSPSARKPDARLLTRATGPDPDTPGINCAEQGVIGALTGVLGSLAALEVIRAIVPFGEDSAGKLLIADTLALRFRTLALPKDPGCPACNR